MPSSLEGRPSTRRKQMLKSPGRSLSLAGRGIRNDLLGRPLAISFEITRRLLAFRKDLGTVFNTEYAFDDMFRSGGRPGIR
jgi:hypothetical protein